MADDDDKTAQEQRARQLRERIARLKDGKPPKDGAGAKPPSPRDFVEERMRDQAARDAPRKKP